MMNKDITVKGTNPITKLDFPDPDVICVEDTFYMISTTMHFMPGAEILRSYDLINWEHASFIYERLDSTPAQRLENNLHIYGKGMWAATIRYHEGMFYVVFVCNDTGKTYLYRSAEIEGPWVKSQIEGFYHDSSLLFDNGSAYLVYGNTDIYLTELNDDLTAPKEGGLHRLIVSDKGNPQLGLEGSHLYKIEGRYYLFMIHSKRDKWRRVEACYSSDSLLGEFTGGDIFDDDLSYRNMGIAQGGIVLVLGMQAVGARRQVQIAIRDTDGVVGLDGLGGGRNVICAAGDLQVVLAHDAVGGGGDGQGRGAAQHQVALGEDHAVGVGAAVRSEGPGDGQLAVTAHGDEHLVRRLGVDHGEIAVGDVRAIQHDLHLVILARLHIGGKVAGAAGQHIDARGGDVDLLAVGHGVIGRAAEVRRLGQIPVGKEIRRAVNRSRGGGHRAGKGNCGHQGQNGQRCKKLFQNGLHGEIPPFLVYGHSIAREA